MLKKEKNRTRARVSRTPTRPAASTYYRSGAASENSPFERRTGKSGRLNKYAGRLADVVAVLILVVILIHSLRVSGNAKVIVDNLSYHSISNYQDSANKYLRAIRNHNKITFNDQGIVDSFKNDYPEVSAAKVELPVFGQQPVIRLNVAAPAAILISEGKKYVIDANGRAAGNVQEYPDIGKLVEVNDESGFQVAKGSQVLSAGNISFINTLISQCRKANIPVSSLTLPKIAQELNLTTADRGYKVKFYLGGDPLIQIGQFMAARRSFDTAGKQPVSYLDVRVNGKIFYK